jgi:hypothetical protein
MKVPGFGVDPLERGHIAHDALERLYNEIASLGGLDIPAAGELQELISESCAAALRKHFAGRDAFDQVALDIEENRLRVLIAKLIEFDGARDPFKVEGTEESAEVAIGPLLLKLRQDRIDQVNTGARLVIDYKTGAKFSLNRWRGARPAEPQLPLYAATSAVDGIAIYNLNGDAVEVYGVATTGVGLDFLKGPDAVVDQEPAEWDQVVAGWRDAFERLADEYAGGDVRVDRNDVKLAEGEFAMLIRIHDPIGEEPG